MTQRFPAVGIDSIRLVFDMQFRRRFGYVFVPWKLSRRKSGRVLWQIGNWVVDSAAAIYHHRDLTLSISYLYPSAPRPQLSVWASVARWRWGHNARLSSPDDLTGLIEAVVKETRRIGITLDVASALLTELHLFRDVEMPWEWKDLLPVLHEVDPPYGTKFEERDRYLLRGSKRSSWAIYDKGHEIQALTQRNEQNDSAALWAGADWKQSGFGCATRVRFEWRLQTALKIRDALGISSPGQMAQSPEIINRKFDEALHKHILKWKLPSTQQLADWSKKKATPALVSRNDPSHIARFVDRLQTLPHGPWEVRLALICLQQLIPPAEVEAGTPWPMARIIKRICRDAGERYRLKAKLHEVLFHQQLPDGEIWGRRYAQIYWCVFAHEFIGEGQEKEQA